MGEVCILYFRSDSPLCALPQPFCISEFPFYLRLFRRFFIASRTHSGLPFPVIGADLPSSHGPSRGPHSRPLLRPQRPTRTTCARYLCAQSDKQTGKCHGGNRVGGLHHLKGCASPIDNMDGADMRCTATIQRLSVRWCAQFALTSFFAAGHFFASNQRNYV